MYILQFICVIYVFYVANVEEESGGKISDHSNNETKVSSDVFDASQLAGYDHYLNVILFYNNQIFAPIFQNFFCINFVYLLGKFQDKKYLKIA